MAPRMQAWRRWAGRKMTRTLTEAAFELERLRVERHAAGKSFTVEQVDCVLCEDNETAFAYCFFECDPEPLLLSFQAPRPFDARRCAEHLVQQSATVH